MPNLQKADEFFSNHLLKEQYFEFPEQTRSAAVAAAVRDITAALKLEAFPEDAGELIYSAVFEQAIYLLLNPHIVTGATDAVKQDIISPRAQAMLFERNTNDETGNEAPGSGNSGSGNTPDDGNSGSGNTPDSGNSGSGNTPGSGNSDSGNTTGSGNSSSGNTTGSGGSSSGSAPVIPPSIQLHLYRG